MTGLLPQLPLLPFSGPASSLELALRVHSVTQGALLTTSCVQKPQCDDQPLQSP